MPTIKYIGGKENGHHTFSKLTGIIWYPGDENQVSEEHAKVLLRHPDAFQAVATKTAGKATPASTTPPVVSLAPGARVGEESGNAPNVDPLAGLDDAGVRAFAKANGATFKGIGVLKGDNLRAKVLAALPK